MSPDLITLGLNLAGLASLAFGGLAYVRSAARKEYASERDFNHLVRNFESMDRAFKLLSEETEEITRILTSTDNGVREIDRNLETFIRLFSEHKAFVLAISNRIEGIAAKLDSATGGWQRTP